MKKSKSADARPSFSRRRFLRASQAAVAAVSAAPLLARSTDAIAAVVIGGTSLMGGQGSLAGTLVGVLIFDMLTNILELHNSTTNVQLVLKGLIIVVTVLLQERNLGELLAPLRRSVVASPIAKCPPRRSSNAA